jgi:hypothetical protein
MDGVEVVSKVPDTGEESCTHEAWGPRTGRLCVLGEPWERQKEQGATIFGPWQVIMSPAFISLPIPLRRDLLAVYCPGLTSGSSGDSPLNTDLIYDPLKGCHSSL